LVGRGILQQLIGTFLAMSAEQQRGVAIRVTGPDWTLEYGDAEIRELAGRPEFSGAFGRWASAADSGHPSHRGEAGDGLTEQGVSGSSPVEKLDPGER
jgi:hypothetical protein